MHVLNTDQKKAVNHDKGPIIVIAGAGTGKTRVITERIVRLIEKKKAKAEEILAVTFTEKAAGEMLERIDQQLPYGYGDLWVLTFHSLCDRILRESSLHIGINPGYELMGYPEQLAFLRKHLFKSFDLEYFRPLNNPYKFIDALIKHVSRLQDEDISPDEYIAYVKSRQKKRKNRAQLMEAKKLTELAYFYKKYQELKLKNNKLDFGDLLYYTLELFRKRENVLKEYQNRFKYVLIDEFQDTNYIQNEIAMLLAAPENNIMVVGDDDQAIYRFRGASISNILQFQERFPDAKVVTLTKNYRSVQEILDGAYKVIVNNNPYRLEFKAGVSKKLTAHREKNKCQKPNAESKQRSLSSLSPVLSSYGGGTVQLFDEKMCGSTSLSSISESKVGRKKRQEKLGIEEEKAVEVVRFQREFDEADFIARKIMEIVGIGDPGKQEEIGGKTKKVCMKFEDIAILVRAHVYLTPIVQRLRFYGIPYQFVGTTDIFNRPVVKDIMALLRLLKDPTDDLAAYRVFAFGCFELNPDGIMSLTNNANYSGSPLYEYLKGIIIDKKYNVTNNDMYFRKCFGVTEKGKVRLRNLFKYVDKSRSKMTGYKNITNELFNLLKQIDFVNHLEQAIGGLTSNLKEARVDPGDVETLYEFLGMVQRFENEGPFTLQELIEYLENLEALGGIEQNAVDVIPKSGVQLITIHSAKGLEFDVVIMPCLVKDRFPSRGKPDLIPIPEEFVKEILPEGDEKIQEERRLFYVGMTRAKQKVILTFSDYYADAKQLRQPSVFLYELLGEEVRSLSYGKTIGIFEGRSEVKVKKLGKVEKGWVGMRPTAVSFSQLNEYKKCPKQYYFKYVLKLRAPPSAILSFGNTIHATLKKFFELQRKVVLSKMSGVEVPPPTLDDLLRLYEENWINKGYRNYQYEENRKKAGQDALVKFYQNLYSKMDFPVKLEEPFHIKIGDITVLGKIDRIDMLDEKKKEVGVIDYKTGRGKEKVEIDEKMQLTIYALAVKERFGWIPKKLSIIRVEDTVRQNIKWDEKLLDKAKDFVLNTVEEIKNKGFPAKPGLQCQYCDYRNICNWAKK